MITKLHIENFKSLADFDLPPNGLRLGNFTCLIGLNGSGKSTLLQAFDFLSQMMIGKMDEWLEQREWKKNELVSYLAKAYRNESAHRSEPPDYSGKRTPVIRFKVHFQFGADEVIWQGRFNSSQLKCTSEKLEKGGETLMEWNEGRLMMVNDEEASRSPSPKASQMDVSNLVFQGSVLSIFRLNGAHPDIARVKQALLGLKSLELLSPHLLRRKARSAEDIGIGGEKLSPFLAKLSPEHKALLKTRLQEFYPHVKDWQVKGYKAGWKGLRIWEDFAAQTPVDASHINDGLLRVIAILAQAYTAHSALLFDEIENGINPELVEKLVNFLIHCDRQVIVTTHSPMILNYIPDAVAKEGVILLYKSASGETRSVRFFDLPGMGDKLKALGPGEVYADTRLADLATQLAQSRNPNSEPSPRP